MRFFITKPHRTHTEAPSALLTSSLKQSSYAKYASCFLFLSSRIWNLGAGSKIITTLTLVSVALVSFFVLATNTNAAPNYQMNYQGKLTNASNVAVADGTYNMRFWLLTTSSIATTSAVWTESLTGTNKVQVTNGLFSVMLGSTSPLTSVDFNQTLYLGVEIGGTSTAAWDGEMSPRKVLGTVPSAFEADRLDGLTSTQFVRTDATSSISASTADTLLSITQNGVGDILNLFDGTDEVFSVLDGGNVGIGTTSPSRKFTVGGDAWFGGNLTGTGTLSISGLATLGYASTTGLTVTNAYLTNATTSNLKVTGLTGSRALFTDANSLLTTSGVSQYLIDAITDETGTGSLVFSTNPLLAGFRSSASSTIGDGTATGGLTIYGNSTTTGNAYFGGTLGIGTTTPSATLALLGSGTTDLFRFASSSGSNMFALDHRGVLLLGAKNSLFPPNIYINGGPTTTAAFTTSLTGNIALGSNAFSYPSTTSQTSYNIALGGYALYGSSTLPMTGDSNIALGLSTLRNVTTGSWNVGIGNGALGVNTSGDQNVAVGILAGNALGTTVTSSNNTFIGHRAGNNQTMGDNNLALGFQVDLASTTGSNQLVIGNLIYGTGLDGTDSTLSSGNIGIGSTTPSRKLTVDGEGYFANNITAASSTITYASSTGLTATYANFTNATTSNLKITGLTGSRALFTDANSLLTTTGLSQYLIDAITDETGTGSLVFSTNPLLAGFRSSASSTIGDGTATGGLTIYGNSTTTGNAYFASNIGIGSSSPNARLTIAGTAGSQTPLFQTASSTGSTTFAVLASGDVEVAGNFVNAGVQWTSRTAASSANWTSIAYGNGTFVALANNGGIMVSADGINWTLATSSTGITMYDVTYGNGQFVVVGDGYLATSQDGKSWTRRSVDTNTWTGVAYGNGLFVVVSNNAFGRIITSPDGIVWTDRADPLADTGTYSDIVYGNGKFVAITSGATNAIYSSDGINWTEGSGGAGMSSVAYGNGTYVAVGSFFSTFYVYSSIDGITWTQRTPAQSNTWTGVAYGNGLFVAISSDGTNRVMTSSDGITWTARSAASASTWAEIGYGNGTFVAVGSSGAVMTSGKTQTNALAHNNIYQGGMSILGGAFNIGTTTASTSAFANNILNIASTTGTSLLTMLETGYMGLGSTSPSRLLTVQGGDAWFGGNLTATGTGKFANLLSTGSSTIGGGTGATGLTIYGGATTTGNAYFAGNLGIGTTSLSARLALVGSGTSDLFRFASSSGSSMLTLDARGVLTFGTSTSADIFINSGSQTRNPQQNGNNIAIGNGTMWYASTTAEAQFNIAIGAQALLGSSSVPMSGDHNVAIGIQALAANASGTSNTAIGSLTLANNTIGYSNTAVGYGSMINNATGYQNAALGMASLQANTQGYQNAAFGYASLLNNTLGTNNTAMGWGSLVSNVSGVESTAVGSQALFQNTGSYNTAQGFKSLYANNAGIANTAMGWQALVGNTSGLGNTGVGYGVLTGTQDGSFNTAIGIAAGVTNTSGISNTYLGFGADGSGSGFSTSTAIGAKAVVGCSNCMVLGGTGANYVNVGIGTSTPSALLTIGSTTMTGARVAGIKQHFGFVNATQDAVYYGNETYITNVPTATSTLVGGMIRIADTSVLGNTVRGFEAQAFRGTNTKGENTGLSGFGRTFGVRGTTLGDAGDTYLPAGIFAETQGTTQGNALRAYSGTITTEELVSLFHDSSVFSGTGLQMNFGNAGGSFAATSSAKFLDLQVAGTSKFMIAANGSTTIGDGVTSASLRIPFGGICVDNDGSCISTTTGQIRSVTSALGNSDLAETYFSNQTLHAGEIVALAGGLSIRRAVEETEKDIIGVVSTKPGLTLGFDDTSLIPGENSYPIGLKGRVPIKLSTENGPIKKGDRIALSSIPGVGMKATESSRVVGIALEDYDGTRAYTAGFLNQFGDDMYKERIIAQKNSDPRAQDGCSYGGGNALGEEVCTREKVAKEKSVTPKADTTREDTLRAFAQESALETTAGNGEVAYVGQALMFIDLAWYQVDRESLVLSELASSTLLLDAQEGETVWSRIKTLAQNFVDGVLTVTGIKADRIEVTNELCVDGVCVTADDLRALLENVHETENTEVMAPESNTQSNPESEPESGLESEGEQILEPLSGDTDDLGGEDELSTTESTEFVVNVESSTESENVVESSEGTPESKSVSEPEPEQESEPEPSVAEPEPEGDSE